MTVDDTEIRFRVPHGTGAANTVVLVVNGAHSNTLLLHYELPVLDSVTLKWQEDDQLAMWQVAAGGQVAIDSASDLNRQPLSERCLLLRLHGSNFGAMPDMVSVSVGGVPCETITLRSHFLLECCTHERRGGIEVVVNEQASNTLPYDIDDIIPVLRIDTVTPDFGPSSACCPAGAAGCRCCVCAWSVANSGCDARAASSSWEPTHDSWDRVPERGWAHGLGPCHDSGSRRHDPPFLSHRLV